MELNFWEGLWVAFLFIAVCFYVFSPFKLYTISATLERIEKLLKEQKGR